VFSVPEEDSDPFVLEQQTVEQIRSSRRKIDAELSKVIVGQADVIEQLLISLFAGGHCLITGAPGLAKTLLVRSIAQVFELEFKRIQFTPDLMPADITGTEILEQTTDGHRAMQFVKGPIFGNVILADEINRTPPKTQAALLEAMQEHQVTVAGMKYTLEEPFFVLATQNPIEMEGTYPLPEAQLDRFMFNVLIDYLPEDDEVAVVQQTTSRKPEPLQPLFDGADVLRFHDVVRKVPRRVAEPDPAGFHAQEIRHAVQRFAGCALFGGRAVEGFRHGLEE
jgi:MoxR-like ATPase